ncbi:MAG: hypothetical protein KAU03_02395, partial [Candidatus Altiarchaeales archaeon]|nr:hypothetical protein [Candidatus Altiarchaeales archaeon]
MDRRYMLGGVIVALLFAVVAYGQLAKYTCTEMSPKMCSMGTCQKGYECTLYEGSCNCIPSGGITTSTTSTLPNCPSSCECMTEENAKKNGYGYCGGKKNLCGYDQYKKPMYCYETTTTTTTTAPELDECPGKCECMTRENAKKKNYEYCKGEKILCGYNQQPNEMYCHQKKEEEKGETPKITVSYTPYSLTTESKVTFNAMAL